MDTVSLQVDILSNSVPSDDVVSCWKLMMENCLRVAIIFKKKFHYTYKWKKLQI